MILRVFRVKVRPGKQAEFKKRILEQTLPWLRRQSGMSASFPGEALEADRTTFALVTVWRDVDALKAFMGENWAKPFVAPDEASLIEEVTVEHYSVFDTEPPAPPVAGL